MSKIFHIPSNHGLWWPRNLLKSRSSAPLGSKLQGAWGYFVGVWMGASQIWMWMEAWSQGAMSFASWIIWFFLKYFIFERQERLDIGYDESLLLNTCRVSSANIHQHPFQTCRRYVQIQRVLAASYWKCLEILMLDGTMNWAPLPIRDTPGPQEAGCFRPLAGWDDLATSNGF